MKPIPLPILFNTESTSELRKLGIEHNEETEVRHIIFYSIVAITPIDHNGHDYTELFANGMTFIVAMPIGSLSELIAAHEKPNKG